MYTGLTGLLDLDLTGLRDLFDGLTGLSDQNVLNVSHTGLLDLDLTGLSDLFDSFTGLLDLSLTCTGFSATSKLRCMRFDSILQKIPRPGNRL